MGWLVSMLVVGFFCLSNGPVVKIRFSAFKFMAFVEDV